MDTKALRQKVLDLAIRGKLVPQNPNDEPASVLLERIRQQKQQMVKEGKLKAKDIKNDTIIFVGEENSHYEKFADGSVKCIEDEIPFDLPDGWAWSKIGPLCEYITSGSRGWAQYYSETGILFLRMGNLSRDSFDLRLDNLQRVNLPDNAEGTRTRVAENDLLFSITAEIGMLGLIPANFEEAYINQHVGLIRFLKDAQTKFFPYILMSEFCRDQYYTVQCGMKNSFRLDNIQNILAPVPPLGEQIRIAEKLSNIWTHIQQIDIESEAASDIISKAKSKILDLAIRGQLVPQDPDDEPASVLLERIRAEKEELIKQGKLKRDKKESVIFRGEDNSYYEKMADGKLHCLDDQLTFELPDGWEWCNLSMIGTTNIGLTYRPTDIEPGGIMVLRSCNIVNDQVDLSDLVRVKTTVRENQFAQKNDILICARNGSRSLVGKCALIPDLGEPASFGAFMAIYRTEYFEFIVHYLRSSFFRSVFDDSNSTAINQLTQDMLKRAIVPLPPLSEQRRIVEEIGAMLFELNQIEKSLS